MNKVLVNKDDLMAAVVENRESHKHLFIKALEGYRKEALDNLNSYVKEIERGATPQIRWQLVVPEDHTPDYDQVIKMLEMSIEDEIWLSNNEFCQYVMDDWGWKQQWTVSNSSYLVS